MKALTVVDLDISDSVRSRYGMSHLIWIVVATRKKVLALDLLAMMAESVALSCEFLLVLMRDLSWQRQWSWTFANDGRALHLLIVWNCSKFSKWLLSLFGASLSWSWMMILSSCPLPFELHYIILRGRSENVVPLRIEEVHYVPIYPCTSQIDGWVKVHLIQLVLLYCPHLIQWKLASLLNLLLFTLPFWFFKLVSVLLRLYPFSPYRGLILEVEISYIL